MSKLRGYVWFARRFGVGTLVRYEQARRAGVTLDYARFLTADERAILEEHGLSMWGKRL